MKFSTLLQKLGKDVDSNSLESAGGNDVEISSVAAVDEATTGTISYIEGAKFASWINKTKATALILPNDPLLQTQATERGIAWISTPDPRLLFAKTIDLYYQPQQPIRAIHPTAVIDPSAEIGSDVYIGPHVVISQQVKIGNGVCIHPNVVIYPQVVIGDHTILHANCTIHERSQIGASCVIHSGAVIGDEGFGFVPVSNGWFKMQQSGYTVLEDQVEVGCNSNIDRPAVGETRIGQNTKIDNLVQIGHGCKIGSNCALSGQVGLAGGVKVGNNVILAGQVGVVNQVKIGDHSIIAAKSGVHSDVPPGAVFAGYPAVERTIFLKGSALYKRLPEIYQLFKQLKYLIKE